MTDFVERYEAQLVAAARARATQPAWRRTRHPRRIVGIALATLAIGGTALAATQPWNPTLGDDRHPGATATQAAPPQDQLDLLGVLRRPQTEADRGPQTTYALSFMGSQIKGLRVPYVRLLHTEPDGRGFILIPAALTNAGREKTVAKLRAEHPEMPAGMFAAMLPRHDQLCVFSADQDRDGKPAGGGFGCYGTEDILAGRAGGSLGRRTYGLVPDGVASIHLRFADGMQLDVPVHDNFTVYTAPEGPSGGGRPVGVPTFPTVTEWRDADGTVTKTLDR